MHGAIAEAGIQYIEILDSRIRGNDRYKVFSDFLNQLGAFAAGNAP